MADFDFTQLKGRMAQAGLGRHVTLTELERNTLLNESIKSYQGEITEADITDGFVTTSMLADRAVSNAKISDSSVTTRKLSDGSITLEKFAEKAYAPDHFSGKGKKYLRKNIAGDKNVLTSDMLSEGNTIYVISYDYDLNGQTISIPQGSVLYFDGGSISNGTFINVGYVINAGDGFRVNVNSFSSDIREIRTSEYSVSKTSSASHNSSVLQAAINSDVAIIIDNTIRKRVIDNVGGEIDDSESITMAEPLYMTRSGVRITGFAGNDGNLYFPNGDGIVWNTKIYSARNYFSNLTINSLGHCFNLSNSGSQNRPYNVYISTFEHLQLISIEGDCVYDGCYGGVAGDIHFQNTFKDISLWTTRYGFNGLRGQTAFFVDGLTDIYVGDSFFYNTCPNKVSNVNSSFGMVTKHFFLFDNAWNSFGASIYCENCSWEGFAEEVILDSDTNNFGFSIVFKKCAFGYYPSMFEDGKLNIYPLTFYKIGNINFEEVTLGSISYADGYCLMKAQDFGYNSPIVQRKTNVDFHIKSAAQPTWELYSVLASGSRKATGTYGNYTYCPEDKIRSVLGLFPKLIFRYEDTVDMGNETALADISVKSQFIVLKSSVNCQIKNINFDTSDVGLATNTEFRPPFIVIRNGNSSGGGKFTLQTGYAAGVVTANNQAVILEAGEMAYCLRNASGRYIMVHKTGNNAFEPRLSGTTEQRPTANTFTRVGTEYFDTTLGKPIWIKSISSNTITWVDATGAIV